MLDDSNRWGYGVSVYFEDAPRINIVWTSDRFSLDPTAEVLCLVPERGQFLWADFSNAICGYPFLRTFSSRHIIIIDSLLLSSAYVSVAALGFVKIRLENPHHLQGDDGNEDNMFLCTLLMDMAIRYLVLRAPHRAMDRSAYPKR